MSEPNIVVFPNLDELSRTAARKFIALAQTQINANNRFTVALAGGSTPKVLYKLLADQNEPFRSQIDWQKVHFFWSDERCVAPDSDESNFRMASENLLEPLRIPPSNFHRFKGELEPQTAAIEYEKVLREFFGKTNGVLPQFDLILLGMGADGHTASLFPGSEIISDTKKLVAAPFVEKFDTFRLTFAPTLINNAANVIFQVAGADKSAALREVLEGENNPKKFPSQIIRQSQGEVFWFVDEAAGTNLTINQNISVK